MLVFLVSLFGLDAALILSINGVGFRIHVFWRFGGCNILHRKGGRKRWLRSTVVLQRFDISTHVIYIISLCAFLTWLMFINVLCCWTGVWLSRNVIFESVCRSACMVLAYVRYVYQCLLLPLFSFWSGQLESAQIRQNPKPEIITPYRGSGFEWYGHDNQIRLVLPQSPN